MASPLVRFCSVAKGSVKKKKTFSPSTLRTLSCLGLFRTFLMHSPPYRVARTTKSKSLHLPPEGSGRARSKEGNLGSGTGVQGGAVRAVGGGDHKGCDADVGAHGAAVGGTESFDSVDDAGDSGGGRGGASGVDVGSPRRSGGMIVAVLKISFVAAPGHTAPKPQTLEYRIDLSVGEGSQEIEVVLGEVDYNVAVEAPP